MKINEIEKHLAFFKDIKENTGNAFSIYTGAKTTKKNRANALNILEERIDSARNYIDQNNLYNLILEKFYSSDEVFELYDLPRFEGDIIKIVRWLENEKIALSKKGEEEE